MNVNNSGNLQLNRRRSEPGEYAVQIDTSTGSTRLPNSRHFEATIQRELQACGFAGRFQVYLGIRVDDPKRTVNRILVDRASDASVEARIPHEGKTYAVTIVVPEPHKALDVKRRLNERAKQPRLVPPKRRRSRGRRGRGTEPVIAPVPAQPPPPDPVEVLVGELESALTDLDANAEAGGRRAMEYRSELAHLASQRRQLEEQVRKVDHQIADRQAKLLGVESDVARYNAERTAKREVIARLKKQDS